MTQLRKATDESAFQWGRDFAAFKAADREYKEHVACRPCSRASQGDSLDRLTRNRRWLRDPTRDTPGYKVAIRHWAARMRTLGKAIPPARSVFSDGSRV